MWLYLWPSLLMQKSGPAVLEEGDKATDQGSTGAQEGSPRGGTGVLVAASHWGQQSRRSTSGQSSEANLNGFVLSSLFHNADLPLDNVGEVF